MQFQPPPVEDVHPARELVVSDKKSAGLSSRKNDLARQRNKAREYECRQCERRQTWVLRIAISIKLNSAGRPDGDEYPF